MANGFIKIGDEITYHGSWGMAAPRKAKVEGIEKCKHEGEKYGTPVKKIERAKKNFGCFDLSDGHWCYGEQIM